MAEILEKELELMIIDSKSKANDFPVIQEEVINE